MVVDNNLPDMIALISDHTGSTNRLPYIILLAHI